MTDIHLVICARQKSASAAMAADLSIAEHHAWGARVTAQLDAAIGLTNGGVVLLAGQLYRQPLGPRIGRRARVPMLGLGIGRQRAWLAAQFGEVRRRR